MIPKTSFLKRKKKGTRCPEKPWKIQRNSFVKEPVEQKNCRRGMVKKKNNNRSEEILKNTCLVKRTKII